MLFAEWEGHTVKLYNQNRQHWRTIRVSHDVVGVQVSSGGSDDNDSTVAISQDNGHTSLYRATGQVIRP